MPKEQWVMGAFQRYLERRRVLKLLAELERTLPKRPTPLRARRPVGRLGAHI
jgi:hypothetical protein